MSTVGRRPGGFKTGGRINRGGSGKGKHFFRGGIDVCKGEQRIWLYMILSIYYIIVCR